MHTGFRWGKVREGDHLEDQGLNERIMVTWMFEKWVGGTDWICLAQDRDWWRALVKAVTILRVP